MAGLRGRAIVSVGVVLGLVLLSGCVRGNPSVSMPKPPTPGPAHPLPALVSGQQRVLLHGLAVTLTAIESSATVNAASHRVRIVVEVFNTTDTTNTIGRASSPVIRNARGATLTSLSDLGHGIRSFHGPYWGMGGPPPGTPQNSDFSPGGWLRWESNGHVPADAGTLTLSWKLDPARTAAFTVRWTRDGPD